MVSAPDEEIISRSRYDAGRHRSRTWGNCLLPRAHWTDYDDEEIARKMSIAASAAYVEWGKTEVNVIDTPGFNMFVHEAPKMVLPVVDAAIVVVNGVAGVEVVTQRVWNDCEEYKTPRLIVVNRMDRDRANAERVLESLINAFGRNVIPIELPIGSEKNLAGVVNLVRMKAYTYELGGNGKGKETEIPANMRAQVQESHEQLVELVAEGDDKLMEKFFEAGTLAEEDTRFPRYITRFARTNSSLSSSPPVSGTLVRTE